MSTLIANLTYKKFEVWVRKEYLTDHKTMMVMVTLAYRKCE